LDEIEAAEYDVSVRCHVGTAKKVALALRAFRNWLTGEERNHG
jgi:hypothetical protein